MDSEHSGACVALYFDDVAMDCDTGRLHYLLEIVTVLRYAGTRMLKVGYKTGQLRVDLQEWM